MCIVQSVKENSYKNGCYALLEYLTSAIGLSDELFHALREAVIQYKLQFTTSPSLRNASRLLSRQIFHLLMVDIDYLLSNSGGAGLSGFQLGDIFIDPARQEITVCGQPVNLRHREFSLLLYFMRNPNIVLTAEQICEHAWGMEYTQPVD